MAWTIHRLSIDYRELVISASVSGASRESGSASFAMGAGSNVNGTRRTSSRNSTPVASNTARLTRLMSASNSLAPPRRVRRRPRRPRRRALFVGRRKVGWRKPPRRRTACPEPRGVDERPRGSNSRPPGCGRRTLPIAPPGCCVSRRRRRNSRARSAAAASARTRNVAATTIHPRRSRDEAPIPRGSNPIARGIVLLVLVIVRSRVRIPRRGVVRIRSRGIVLLRSRRRRRRRRA